MRSSHFKAGALALALLMAAVPRLCAKPQHSEKDKHSKHSGLATAPRPQGKVRGNAATPSVSPPGSNPPASGSKPARGTPSAPKASGGGTTPWGYVPAPKWGNTPTPAPNAPQPATPQPAPPKPNPPAPKPPTPAPSPVNHPNPAPNQPVTPGGRWGYDQGPTWGNTPGGNPGPQPNPPGPHPNPPTPAPWPVVHPNPAPNQPVTPGGRWGYEQGPTWGNPPRANPVLPHSQPAPRGQPIPGCCAPPPHLRPTPISGGGQAYVHPDGRRWEYGPQGQILQFSKPGTNVHFRGDGSVNFTDIVRPDHGTLHVYHPLRGHPVIEVMRPDHTRILVLGTNRGYLERPLPRPDYFQRTYVVGRRSYAFVYRTNTYRGVVYYRYIPSAYYRPVFYVWAAARWPVPVAYSWSWYRDPWFQVFGAYLAPRPVYTSPALWLTDFILAESLRAAYDSGARSAPDGTPAGALTPEVKQAIAEEVRRELDAERAEDGQPAPAASDAPPPALDPTERVFIAAANLDLTTANGPCALTAGDVLFRTDDAPGSGNLLRVRVLSGKTGDCAVNATIQIRLDALQEMHNQFRQELDLGLDALAQNQGRGSMPAAPAGAPRSVREAQATPDPGTAAALADARRSAEQTEAVIQNDLAGTQR